MKECRSCNRTYEDSEQFCVECGAKLEVVKKEEEKISKKDKKSKRWLAELIAAILLIIASVAATLYTEHTILPEVQKRLWPEEQKVKAEEKRTKGKDEKDESIKDKDENTKDTVGKKVEKKKVPVQVNLEDIQVFTGGLCISEISGVHTDNVGNEYAEGYYIENCEGTYLLEGKYKTLTLDLALDDKDKNTRNVVFLEFYDENGTLLGKTDEIKSGVRPKEYSFSVEGVEELEIIPNFSISGSYYAPTILTHGIYLETIE